MHFWQTNLTLIQRSSRLARFAASDVLGFAFRSPVAVALEEIFAMEIGSDMKEFEQKVADKMRSVIKIFDVDRLWSAALVHDRVLKCVQVSAHLAPNQF